MRNLIPVVRVERQQEMNQYEEKGYRIQDRKRYLMTGEISLDYMGKTYTYGIQVTQDEIYFYISRDSANVYLSIAEIYELLWTIRKTDGDVILGALKRQLKVPRREKGEFRYKGIGYIMPKPVALEKEGQILLPDSGMQIKYSELFLLILLIQAKSNALFQRSTGVKRRYVNGILRMLVLLQELQEEDDLLQELGWKWNEECGRYMFMRFEQRTGRMKYKYYLTNKEYELKMKIKKS